MKRTQANKILGLLEKINTEVDQLGKMIFRREVQPAPVKVKVNERLKFK